MEKKKNGMMVRISNDLNQMQLVGFTGIEQDLLMALFFHAQNQGEKTITVKYQDLRKICNTDKTETYAEFHERMDTVTDKLMQCRICSSNSSKSKIDKINIFSSLHLDLEEKEMTYAVTDEWAYLFNDLAGSFTLFDLFTLVGFKRKHTKTLYRMLCQFRDNNGNGWWDIPLEDTEKQIGFRSLFEIPKYAIDKKGIVKKGKDGRPLPFENKRILADYIKPAMEEMIQSKAFSKITCTVKKSNRQGAPVEGFYFEFSAPEKRKQIADSVDEIKEYILRETGLPEESAGIIAQKAIKNKRDKDYIHAAYTKAVVSAKDVGKLMSHFMDFGFDEKKPVRIVSSGKDYNKMVIEELIENMNETQTNKELKIVEEYDDKEGTIPGQYTFTNEV